MEPMENSKHKPKIKNKKNMVSYTKTTKPVFNIFLELSVV